MSQQPLDPHDSVFCRLEALALGCPWQAVAPKEQKCRNVGLAQPILLDALLGIIRHSSLCHLC